MLQKYCFTEFKEANCAAGRRNPAHIQVLPPLDTTMSSHIHHTCLTETNA